MNAIVLGAGLSGLSCAYELARNGVDVTVLEKEPEVGGLAKSFTKKGFTYDLGPHRFHTKQDYLVDRLKDLMDNQFVVKNRKSRIYMKNRFFDYPLKAGNAIFTMPPHISAKILYDYVKVKIKNRINPQPDDSFESWVTNRFGETLYRIFFGEYTEKTWGIPCTQISADWAAQRISLLSLWDTIKKTLIRTGNTPRTYVSKFYYPNSGGMGRISERYVEEIKKYGGVIHLNTKIEEIGLNDKGIESIAFKSDSKKFNEEYDIVFSTIPLTTFVELSPKTPKKILDAVSNLMFRSIIFVHLIIDKPMLSDDHWIYLPEKHLLNNRISESKNFNVANTPEDKTIVGAEVTCNYDDEIWNMKKKEMTEKVTSDLIQIGLADEDEIKESFVYKMRHAYPIYDLDYKKHLDPLRDYLFSIENLRFFGRNAMFRYNNMDHSLDMGIKAAESVLRGGSGFSNVGTEQKYFG